MDMKELLTILIYVNVVALYILVWMGASIYLATKANDYREPFLAVAALLVFINGLVLFNPLLDWGQNHLGENKSHATYPCTP